MATITGLTAERMLEIEAASVVDGDVVGNDLILAKHDGTIINAGNVRGPAGPTGPMGSALSVMSAVPVRDVGIINQIRAGRQLTPSDFTNMGLSAPAGLWNLSNFNDSSGNARHLTNKSVPSPVTFASGINGLANTAAQFRGPDGTPANTPVLYIPDTGAADSLRIRHGTVGLWMRTDRRGTIQNLVAKANSAAQQATFLFRITTSNLMEILCGMTAASFAGANGSDFVNIVGSTDVCDGRWHFVSFTADGTYLRIYVDGILDATRYFSFPMFGGTAPFNIGGYGGDATTTPVSAHYGRLDEVFVTQDALNPDQLRNLYCASIPHALGVTPSVIRLSVRRGRRGGALAPSDFPAQPARLYNFTNGALTDEGSNNTTLGNAGVAPTLSPGLDGSKENGYTVGPAGLQHFSSSDAGLPSGLSPRSYGAFFKSTFTQAAGSGIIGYGAVGSGDARPYINSTGYIVSASNSDLITGPFVADGTLHHIVVVEDNGAVDSKRKLYIDGNLVGTSNVLNPTTLGGAGRFRIGSIADGTAGFFGQIDAAFVYAGALTSDEVRALYQKGSMLLRPSPKSDADHIEAIEAGRMLALFESVDGCDQIDMAVMS